jgi:hypothetical protein
MFIFGNPIPSKFVGKTIRDWLFCRRLADEPKNRDAKLHFVYFSYQPDFHYLQLSLQSLVANIPSDAIASVHLFEDQKATFSADEVASLQSLCPQLVMQKVENFSWASPDSTHAEIGCFSKVATDAKSNDMLVKVDSDILFLPSDKMLRLLRSPLLAVGDGHNEEYRFAQGGLYMMRISVVTEQLEQVNLERIHQIVAENGSNGEDRTLSSVLKQNGNPFQFTRLMLFPSEYSKIERLSAFNKWDFCAAHFVKDKEKMARYIELYKH